MDLWGTRRRDEQARRAEHARARLAALRPRRGWTPRVPAAAGDLAMLAVQAERMDIGASTTADAEAATARPDASQPPGSQSPGSQPPGRHRAVGGVSDRLPLPLRAMAESLPSGVRNGEAGLQRMHAMVIGVVVLAGLVIALIWGGLGRPDVTPVATPSSTTVATGTSAPVEAEPADDTGGDPQDRSPDPVVVHVAGKVAHPGIVELPAGSRVVDAVEAAGGANDGVDLSTLNLARVLVDGEQVAVGIEPVAPPPPTGDAAEPVVNLNTAASAELETLPGIGPALAANIVAWRDEHGHFTAIEELQEVSGIGPAKLAALADRVTL